jgi:hypothetical protein
VKIEPIFGLPVGSQSAAFATEGGIRHICVNEKALEGHTSGKFPDGSVIVYHLLEARVIAGNTIEGPTRRIDVMVKQSEPHRTAGGWSFVSFPGGSPANGKLTAERPAACADCHANWKSRDFVFREFRK